MTTTPPIFQSIVDMMGDLADAFRPLGEASRRAAEAMSDLSQAIADRRLADLIGVPLIPFGIPVHLASVMEDGKLIYLKDNPAYGMGPALFLGTYRAPARLFGAPGQDDVKDEARRIVRRGMADVCEFIGEDPEWLGRSEDILDLMRSGTRAHIPEDAA